MNIYFILVTLQLLQNLIITGTSLSKLSICNPTKNTQYKDVVGQQNTHTKYICDRLQHLRLIDIRNNQLSHLEANGLPHLTEVYLSGILDIFRVRFNADIRIF